MYYDNDIIMQLHYQAVVNAFNHKVHEWLMVLFPLEKSLAKQEEEASITRLARRRFKKINN